MPPFESTRRFNFDTILDGVKKQVKTSRVDDVKKVISSRIRRCDELIAHLAAMSVLGDRMGNDESYLSAQNNEITNITNEVVEWGVEFKSGAVRINPNNWHYLLKVKHGYMEQLKQLEEQYDV